MVQEITYCWSGLISQDPSASFVMSPTTVDFEEDESQKQVTLSISSTAFIASGRSFEVAITNVELLSDGG